MPPIKAPNVTAGLTWPPEMLADIDTATNNPKAWARAAWITPDGVPEPFEVRKLKAIPEPSPAKTKMRVLMNSARATLKMLGW